MDKIDPGPGYRLLEVGEYKPEGYEVHQPHGGWGLGESIGSIVREHQRAMRIKLPETLAQAMDAGIQATVQDAEVRIRAPKPSADECRKSLEAAGIKPEDFAKSPGAQILQQDFQALEDKIYGTLASMGLLHLLPKPFTSNKYTRDLLSLDGRRVPVDVYSVLAAFPSNNGAVDHALKKLLAPGQRGQKDRLQDLKEARASLDRAIQMEEG